MPYFVNMIVKLALILVTGIVAGFINVNAGGGSLLTLPALIFMGLPSAVANGTNRIAILIGAISATRNFKNKDVLDWRLGLELAIPALIGAIIGSTIVISIPDKVFNLILSCVMILVLAAIIVNPQDKIKSSLATLTNKRKVFAGLVFFLVGFYGGFVQAGVGFLIMGSLLFITGMPLVRINALKVLIVLVYTVFSLLVFMLNRKVDLLLGLVLSVGNAIGAHIGSNFAITKGEKWIRVILIFMVIVMALKLSGIFSFNSFLNKSLP